MAANEEQPPPSTAATEPPPPSSPSMETPSNVGPPTGGSDSGENLPMIKSSGSSFSPAQPKQDHSNLHIQAEQTSSVPAATATSLMQVPAVTSNTTEQKMISNQRKMMQRRKSSSVRLPVDGYNWQSSREKRIRGFKFRRSFKCSTPKCRARKNVEYTRNGRLTAISYDREHNHKPLERVNSNEISKIQKIYQDYGEDSSRLKEMDSLLLAEMEPEAEYLSGASSEEVDEDIHDPKRRMYPAAYRTLTAPRFIEQKTSAVDLTDDGYRWLKYAETLIKDNPNPRRYYRCATLFCNVIKHVQRSSTTPTDVLTTYEGTHNHPKPPALSNSRSS